MVAPLGYFDETLLVAGWFDETAQLLGWFDRTLLNDGAPVPPIPPVDPPRTGGGSSGRPRHRRIAVPYESSRPAPPAMPYREPEGMPRVMVTPLDIEQEIQRIEARIAEHRLRQAAQQQADDDDDLLLLH